VRLRRRVSSTVLNPAPSPTSTSPPLPSPSRHPPPFSTSILLPCCSRPYSFTRLGNPFARRAPLPTTDSLLPFSALPSLSTSWPRRHFRYCSPMALFRPDLFERQNVPGALISCGSEREMVDERVREGRKGVLSPSRGRGREQKRELCGSYKCFGASARP
jgi:hypothetical protein